MKKIPSLFVRDYERIITGLELISASAMPDGNIGAAYNITDSKKGRFLATDQVTPGCEWVINGEGVATRKWDGTCCMIRDGILYKRYDAKQGKTPPHGFEPAQDPDPITGHWPGWLRANREDKADKWLYQSLDNSLAYGMLIGDGTYEAIGPKINGGKDASGLFGAGFDSNAHYLMKHGDWALPYLKPMANIEDWKRYFSEVNPHIEGIVFHHPDGRMCKVKRTDFGLKW